MDENILLKKKLDKANSDIRNFAYISKRQSKTRLGLRKHASTNRQRQEQNIGALAKDQMRDLFYECVNDTVANKQYQVAY